MFLPELLKFTDWDRGKIDPEIHTRELLYDL